MCYLFWFIKELPFFVRQLSTLSTLSTLIRGIRFTRVETGCGACFFGEVCYNTLTLQILMPPNIGMLLRNLGQDR